MSSDRDLGIYQRFVASLQGTPQQRLRIDGALGTGGMAQVDAVFDQTLLRHLARKTLHRQLLDDADVLRLFIREMHIAAGLDHPNIIPIHECGIDQDGCIYFTMKKVTGSTLKEFIKALPPGRLERRDLFTILETLVKVCDALAFAHHRGVVHCDLKPDHIVMADFGQVFLMDWGIAHVLEDNSLGLEPDSPDDGPLIAGSCQFMAPEQASGERALITPATDVFALGAILYSVFARRPPYLASALGGALERARECAFPPLQEIVEPGIVPPDLEQLILRAMAAQPGQRLQSVQELGEELRKFMRGEGEFPTVELAAGTTIVREGERGDCAYIVRSGRCEAYRETDAGRVSLEFMEPGRVFGELALLTASARSASVVASDEGVVLHKIRMADFDAEIQQLKPWVREIIHALAQRIRRSEHHESLKLEEPTPNTEML